MADKSVNLSVLVDVLFQAGKVDYGKLATDLLKTLQKLELPKIQLSPDISINPKSREKLLKELDTLLKATELLEANQSKKDIAAAFTGVTEKGKPARRLQAAETRAVEFTETIRRADLPETERPSEAQLRKIAKRYNALFNGVRDVITREAQATKLFTSENLQQIVASLGQGKVSILDPSITGAQKKAVREYIELQQSFLKSQRALVKELEKTPGVASLFGIDLVAVKEQLLAAENGLRTLKRNADESAAISKNSTKNAESKLQTEKRLNAERERAEKLKQQQIDKAFKAQEEADQRSERAAKAGLERAAVAADRQRTAQAEADRKALATAEKQNEDYLKNRDKREAAEAKARAKRLATQTTARVAKEKGAIETADPLGLKAIERDLKKREERLRGFVERADYLLNKLQRKERAGKITRDELDETSNSIRRKRDAAQETINGMAAAYGRVADRQRELNQLAKTAKNKTIFGAYNEALDQESRALDALATDRLRKLADKLAKGQISILDPSITAQDRKSLNNYVAQYEGFIRKRQDLINRLAKQPAAAAEIGIDLGQMRAEQREAKQLLSVLSEATNQTRAMREQNRKEAAAAEAAQRARTASEEKLKAARTAANRARVAADAKAKTAPEPDSALGLKYTHEALVARRKHLQGLYDLIVSRTAAVADAQARGVPLAERWANAQKLAIGQKNLFAVIQNLDQAIANVSDRYKTATKRSDELKDASRALRSVVQTGRFIEKQAGGQVGKVEDLSDLGALKNYYGEKAKLLEAQKRRYEDMIRAGKEFDRARYDRVTKSLAGVNKALLETHQQIKLVRDAQVGRGGDSVNAQWAAEGRRIIDQYGGIGRAARTVAKDDLPLVIEAFRQNIREAKALRDVMATSGVAVSRRDFQNASRAVTENNEALRVAQARFRGVHGVAEQTGRLLRQFGRFAIGYGALYQVMYGITQLTRSVIDLDQALRSIQAVTGATNTQMEAMGDAVKRVAQETQFSTTETAKAAQVLAQAGVEPKDMERNLRAVATLASATAAPIELASDLMSSVKNVYDNLDERTIANLLTRALNISKITAEDLKTIISLGAQTSKAYGITAQQFLAAASTLRNAGLKASTTATGYREALLEVFSPDTKTVKAWVKRYREIGESMSEEAVRAMLFRFRTSQAPLEAAIGELRRLGFQGEGRAVFGRAFDRRAENALQALVNRYEELQTISRTLSIGEAAFAGAQVQMKGLQASLENLGGAMTVFTAEIAKKPVSAMEQLADSVTDVLERLTKLDIELTKERGSGLGPVVGGAVTGAFLGGITGKGVANRAIRAVGGAAIGGAASSAGEKALSEDTSSFSTEAIVGIGTLLAGALAKRARLVYEKAKAAIKFSSKKAATEANLRPLEKAVAAGEKSITGTLSSKVFDKIKGVVPLLLGGLKFTLWGGLITFLLNFGDIIRSLPGFIRGLPRLDGLRDLLLGGAQAISSAYQRWFGGLSVEEADLVAAQEQAAAARQISQDAQNKVDDITESFKDAKLSQTGYAAKEGTFAANFEKFIDDVQTSEQKINSFFRGKFDPKQLGQIKEKLLQLERTGYESGSQVRKQLQAELNSMVVSFGGVGRDYNEKGIDQQLSQLTGEVTGLRGTIDKQLVGMIQLMSRLKQLAPTDLAKSTPVERAYKEAFDELLKIPEYEELLFKGKKATYTEYVQLVKAFLDATIKREAEYKRSAQEQLKAAQPEEAAKELAVVFKETDTLERKQRLEALLASKDSLSEATYTFLLSMQQLLDEAAAALSENPPPKEAARRALQNPAQRAKEEQERPEKLAKLNVLREVANRRVEQFQKQKQEESLRLQDEQFKLLQAFVKDYNKPEFQGLLNAQATAQTNELLEKLITKNQTSGQFEIAPNAANLLTEIDANSLIPDIRIINPAWKAIALAYENTLAQMSKQRDELNKEDERLANEGLENTKKRFQEIADTHKDMLNSMKDDLSELERYNKAVRDSYDDLRASAADLIEDAEVASIKKKTANDIEAIKDRYAQFERYVQQRIDSGKLSKRQQQDLREQLRAAKRESDARIENLEDTSKRISEEKVATKVADHLQKARDSLAEMEKIDLSVTGEKLKENVQKATDALNGFKEAHKNAIARARELEDQGKVGAVGYELAGLTEDLKPREALLKQRQREVAEAEKAQKAVQVYLRELTQMQEKVRTGEITDPRIKQEIEKHLELVRKLGLQREDMEKDTQENMLRRLEEYGAKARGAEKKVAEFKKGVQGGADAAVEGVKKATEATEGFITALSGEKIPVVLDEKQVEQTIAGAKKAVGTITGYMAKLDGTKVPIYLDEAKADKAVADVKRTVGTISGYMTKADGTKIPIYLDEAKAEKAVAGAKKAAGTISGYITKLDGTKVPIYIDEEKANKAVADTEATVNKIIGTMKRLDGTEVPVYLGAETLQPQITNAEKEINALRQQMIAEEELKLSVDQTELQAAAKDLADVQEAATAEGAAKIQVDSTEVQAATEEVAKLQTAVAAIQPITVPVEAPELKEAIDSAVELQATLATEQALRIPVDTSELEQVVAGLSGIQTIIASKETLNIPVEYSEVQAALQKLIELQAALAIDQTIRLPVDTSELQNAISKLTELQNVVAAENAPEVTLKGDELIRLADRWNAALGEDHVLQVSTDDAQENLQFTASLLDEVTGEHRQITITANVNAATQQLQVLQHQVQTFRDSGEIVTVQLNTAAAQEQLAAMQQHLQAFDSKDIAVAVDTGQALFNLQELLSVMNLLVDKTITVTVNVVRTGDTGLKKGGWAETAPPVELARGGKVYGGYGGGDKIPALLEPGEFVVRKETAAQHAQLLQAINRQPSIIAKVDGEALQQLASGGLVARYATGGLVDYQSAMSSITGSLQQQRPQTTSALRLQRAVRPPAGAQGQGAGATKERVGETIKVELAVGQKVAELFGRRDQVSTLTSALKEARRGY